MIDSLYSLPFDLSVTNSTGHDATDSIAILLHQQAVTMIEARKQASSRPINECPHNLEFLGSRCIRSHNARAYSVLCSAIPNVEGGRSIRWGSCSSNEICSDGRARIRNGVESHIATVAWCVSQEEFVKIAMTNGSSQTSPSTVQADFHAVDTNRYSVEALLTSLDSQKAIKAQYLDIQAQTADVIGNVASWRTLNGGEMECSSCASIGIMSLPVQTRRIRAHVDLETGTASALLYLSVVSVI